MASNIDVNVPSQSLPTTASVRGNFAIAKSEIEALQASLSSIGSANITRDAQLGALATTSGTNTGDQTIILSGDCAGSGTGAITVTVNRINGVDITTMGDGLLKNVGGILSPAVRGIDYAIPAGQGPGGVLPTPAEINALGIPLDWDASTNTPALTSATAPLNDNTYIVSVAGATNLDGITTWSVGDIAYFDGLAWKRIIGGVIPATTAILKGDGAGGAIAASPKVDYLPGVLYATGVPICLPGPGTIGINGAVTFNNNFLQIYGPTYGGGSGLWVRFEATVIDGTNIAGYYWVVMDSVNTGIVYNNIRQSTDPIDIPTTLVPFVGTTGTAFSTPTGNLYEAIRIPVPGGTLGPNGTLQCNVHQSNSTPNGTLKYTRVNYAGVALAAVAGATAAYVSTQSSLSNRGKETSQVLQPVDAGTGGYGLGITAIDTTLNQDIIVYQQLQQFGVADWVVLEAVRFVVYPA